LRAILKNDPDALDTLVQRHDLDILCLQETKLQNIHLNDPKLKLRGFLLNELGYDAYYSCSTVKKGYSGTAVFIKRRGNDMNGTKQKLQTTISSFFALKEDEATSKTQQTSSTNIQLATTGQMYTKNVQPENVTYTMGIDKHDQEGRLIVVDFPLFTMCNVYVPNSGQNLDRLKYRTDEWDKDFISFMKNKQQTTGRPIIWVGDLNVAHTKLEVWNDGAKHLDKQAGVTPEERLSFQEQLESGGYIDAFRRLHPTASGHYTYWSVRAGNRQPNKGLRLDYFICDPSLFDDKGSQSSSNVIVRDCYMDYNQMGSDHCPIILEMEMKF
jgi:exodeoxyribonuclease III